MRKSKLNGVIGQPRTSGKVFNPDMENGQELVKTKSLRPGIGERKTCSGNPEQNRGEGAGSKR